MEVRKSYDMVRKRSNSISNRNHTPEILIIKIDMFCYRCSGFDITFERKVINRWIY